MRTLVGAAEPDEPRKPTPVWTITPGQTTITWAGWSTGANTAIVWDAEPRWQGPPWPTFWHWPGATAT